MYQFRQKSHQKNHSLKKKFSIKHSFWKCILPITGFLALIWFLIRVIPKPSRATYPCQRVAFPLASGFVIWLMGIIGSITAFKKAKINLKRSRYFLAVVFIIAAVFFLWTAMSFNNQKPVYAHEPLVSNQPLGTGLGIHQGRVVWVYDPNATDWVYTSSSQTDHWYESHNTDQTRVNLMLSRAVRALADETADANAWDAIFRNFNISKGKGDVGYTPGEKIAIKANHTLCYNADSNFNKVENHNYIDNSPQLTIALLLQLIDEAGVNPSDITIGDPGRIMPNYWYDMVHGTPGLENVVYLARVGGDGRTQSQYSNVEFYFSDPDPSRMSGVTEVDHIPQSFAEADYFINFPILKTHNMGGITVNGKNHYGSLRRNPNAGDQPNPDAWYNMHDSLPANTPGMGNYRALVDLMGHPELGGKTLLSLIDGLFAGENWQSIPVEWNMSPFNGDWPSSIFLSQDQVSADSVSYDFLYEEWPGWPGMSGADDYLHEAALIPSPSSGTNYDPNNDGGLTESLGVHEHWNNADSKKYSRNLDPINGQGIELVMVTEELIDHAATLTEVYYVAGKYFEGPTWDSVTGKLYFTNRTEDRIMQLDSPGTASIWADSANGTNGTFLSLEGRLLAAQENTMSIAAHKIGTAGPRETQILADSADGINKQPNDLCQTIRGDIYFTGPSWPAENCVVYRLAQDGTVTEVITDMTQPNGIIASNNGTKLYISDSNEKLWKVYPINSDGTVDEAGGKIFFDPDVPDMTDPDGMTIDEWDNLYLTGRGGVWIVSPQGEQLDMIPIPEFCSNVTFGGQDNNTLYITCQDKIYSMDMQVDGGGWSATLDEPQGDVTIFHTEISPSIDAAVDSMWSNVPENLITKIPQGTIDDKNDLSASWQAMWDSNNLYFLIEVTDQTLIDDSTDIWQDDCVEIYIDADNSKGTSYDGINDFEYLFGWGSEDLGVGVNSAANTTGITYAFADTIEGYRFEVLIPWSTLGVSVNSGDLFGLDIHVCDDDDGGQREGKISWFTDEDTAWHDPNTLSNAYLDIINQPPGMASNPVPSDGAFNVSTLTDLGWDVGLNAASHDVYFGTADPPSFAGNVTQNNFDPGTLSYNTTYFWRIDEKNAYGTTAGTLWSFTTGGSVASDALIPDGPVAPQIDGAIDSVWTEQSGYLVQNIPIGTVSSDSDLSGIWRAIWDTDNLYFLVEVTDDLLVNDSTNSWADDSVEIYIDADNSDGTTYDGINDYQYIFRYNDPGTVHIGSNSAYNTTGISFVINEVTEGYIFECSIPWATLGVTPDVNNIIGLDIHLNDDDDGGDRDGKKSWFTTGDTAWHDPSTLGDGLLEEGEILPGQPAAPDPADSTSGISVNTTLNWNAGTATDTHNLYFGTVSPPPLLTQTALSSYEPNTLEYETTYYWQVVEENQYGTTPGQIWSFTTEVLPQVDVTIPEIMTAPVIDGSVDSQWSDASFSDIAIIPAGEVNDVNDLYGTWKALWDANNIYFLVDVDDDILINDSATVWKDDSVEIYIDADNSKGTSYDGINDYQYQFGYDDPTTYVGVGPKNTEGVIFDIIQTADGYILECLIPWSTLGVTPAADGLIGVEVHLNDDDNGGERDGKRSWITVDDTAWNDPSTFGTGLLQGWQGPSDIDNDGISDANDNCPDTYNPDQTDTDGDGYGDECDTDDDDDGILDIDDNCPLTYNPSQYDSDNDGLGDECECLRANINGMGSVDFHDLEILASNWNYWHPAADVDYSGICDMNDLMQICQHWLSTCEEAPTYLSFWRFEGNALDEAGNNDGVMLNGATTVYDANRGSEVLSLDGIDDYVDVNNFDIYSSGLTITAWIKTDNLIDQSRFISKATSEQEQDHYWMLGTYENNGMKLRFRLKTDGTTSTLIANSGDLTEGEWIFVTAVYDGTDMILYKNAIKIGRMSKTGTISTDPLVDVNIGKNPVNGYEFRGLIDDMAIYEYALTLSEIQSLYSGE